MTANRLVRMNWVQWVAAGGGGRSWAGVGVWATTFLSSTAGGVRRFVRVVRVLFAGWFNEQLMASLSG